MQELNEIVGDIYDCAANPELWPKALNRLRDSLGCAYAMVSFTEFSAQDKLGSMLSNRILHSDWDPIWFQRILPLMNKIPHVDVVFRNDVDTTWIQMEHLAEHEFRKSEFYQQWVKPQKLRDCINTTILNRQLLRGGLSLASYEEKPLLGERERKIADYISPHLRRALSINDLVDKSNFALMLYRNIVDKLSVAVILIGPGGKLVFANAKADELLSSGDLLRLSGSKLVTNRSDVTGNKLDDAIARGTKGDTAVGISGIGVPLVGLTGERAAAYVLPIAGKDVRGEMGRGHAAVFIARRGEQQPMAIEILRTVFDLTPTEARVAFATSIGDKPEAIAVALGNTADTVRSHLKNIYLKTDVNDKTALAARVNALVPPVA